MTFLPVVPSLVIDPHGVKEPPPLG